MDSTSVFQTIFEISTIILGVSSIITAIATIIVLRKLNRLQNDSIELEKAKNQPIFLFETKDQRCYDKANSDHTESIMVKNVDANFRFAKEIEVSTIIYFHILDLENNQRTKHYVEYEFFYGKNLLKFDVAARQSESYSSKGNLDNVDRIIYMPYLQEQVDIFGSLKFLVSRFNLFKVEYEDIYGETHVRYYKDNREIDKNEYDSIKEESILHTIDRYTIAKSLVDVYAPILEERKQKIESGNYNR